ncbi:hypothetical protein [Saccharothrix sp. ALI-22-I]|uniref:hypothetical protein n=1 Tax=Saccharothrix sp. ALI-22-I TaxID=1933778 RepID=UPI00117A472C|nr:hypothetical protein [Saccharothrix sp. ALI-22-I]
MRERLLKTYLVLLAPVLNRKDGVTSDPVDLDVAEAILMAAESADGVGLTRSEIAARAGIDPDDDRFLSRFAMLVTTGALQGLRREKKHQDRYFPDPLALLAAEILARLSRDHGAEELHSILVDAADQLEAAFDGAPESGPSVDEVDLLMIKLSALLHAYAQRMEAAVAAGTYDELVSARTGASTGRQMIQIERICRAINRDGSPYRPLFHSANRLLAAGQRFVTAAEQVAGRLVEEATSGEGVLSLAGYDDYRDVAIHADLERLATVAATVPMECMPPLVHLSDLAHAATTLDDVPRERTVPEPPPSDPGRDPSSALVERRRLAEQRSEARRAWAQRALADTDEADLTLHGTTWPHAARLLADVMALSRDPSVPAAGDIGDPPLIEPASEVTIRHPLRLRRLEAALPTRTAMPEHTVEWTEG